MSIQTQPREEIAAWLEGWYEKVDSLTTTSLPGLFHATSRVQFANNPEFIGIDAITSFFNQIFSQFSYLKHTILHFDVIKNTIYTKTTITYGIANDPENIRITLPGMLVFHLDPEKKVGEPCVERFEVYVDIGPVLGRIGEVGSILGKS